MRTATFNITVQALFIHLGILFNGISGRQTQSHPLPYATPHNS